MDTVGKPLFNTVTVPLLAAEGVRLVTIAPDAEFVTLAAIPANANEVHGVVEQYVGVAPGVAAEPTLPSVGVGGFAIVT
jgi:hypothetical protein